MYSDSTTNFHFLQALGYNEYMRQRYLELQRRRLLRLRLGKVKLRTWSSLAFIALIGLVGFLLFVGVLFAWYAKDLPRPDKVRRTEGLSTVVLDRTGERLYDIFENENREPVRFEDIPKFLKDATVAIEDKGFYKHQGLSTSGIFRALLSIAFFRGFQGGSTLTQQLVKTVLLTKERTLPRKMKEAILAIQIERKYSKDEILQMYLNEVPYGGIAVGVESASHYYFDKPVKELGLVESAVIAGLPQAPSTYSPFTGQAKAYVGRTQSVLRRMREDGYISAIQETQAREQLENIQFASASTGLRAPHFVAYVRDQLVEKFGTKMVEGGGLRVTTTLDWDLQEKAQRIVKEEVDKAKKLKVSNGAAVIVNPKTGEILAMVGSKDYDATDSAGLKFNVVTQGLRQPGSAIKPITYAAAFKKGYTASTLLLDVDTKYPSGDPSKPEYNPKNYDNKFRGPIQLRYALANSINTIAVKVSALVGIKDVLRTAFDMGLSTLEPTNDNMKRIGLSLTLGGGEVTLLELTNAFGVFATGGQKAEPIAILKVEDPKGKVLFEQKPAPLLRVLPEDVSYLVNSILSDNEARKEIFGLRSFLQVPGKIVAAKTGTTDDKRDNWAIGYTPSVAIGTWVGNNDNSPMHPSLASGATGAAPIWYRLMQEALKNLPAEPFSKPSTVMDMEVDAYGGGQPVAGYPTRQEAFIKGTEPTGIASVYQSIKVSRKDNSKLANSVEIAKGEYDTKPFVVFKEQDPVSGDGKNRWQEGIDVWLGTQGDSKFHPPTETYKGSDQLTVTIKEPNDMARMDSNTVKVVAEAFGLEEIKKIELFVDGTLVREKNESKIDETININNGSHAIKVKATDGKGNTADREIHIGINEAFTTPTPNPTPTPSLAPTPTP